MALIDMAVNAVCKAKEFKIKSFLEHKWKVDLVRTEIHVFLTRQIFHQVLELS